MTVLAAGAPIVVSAVTVLPAGAPLIAVVAVYVGAALAGYAIGALNPAAGIARLRGVDLRSVGSGNPGATNAGRAFGWRTGVLVGVLDVLKDWVPVVALEALGLHGPALVAGLAAVLGHITSPLLKGRGGKGVATSFGAILGVQPMLALVVLVVFALGYAVTRRIGLASVLSSLALVPGALLLGDPTSDVLFAAALTVLVVVRHRTNLRAAVQRD